MAVHREVVDTRDEDVDITVAVDVGHGDARLPADRISDAGALRDVLEPVIALVYVEPIGADVRGEVQIGQAIVVDVAHSDTAAVVEIQVGQDVER